MRQVTKDEFYTVAKSFGGKIESYLGVGKLYHKGILVGSVHWPFTHYSKPDYYLADEAVAAFNDGTLEWVDESK